MSDELAAAIGRLRSTLAFYWSRPEVDDVQPAGSGYGVLIGESDRQLILDALEEAQGELEIARAELEISDGLLTDASGNQSRKPRDLIERRKNPYVVRPNDTRT